MTTDEDQVAYCVEYWATWSLEREQVIQVGRLCGIEKMEGKREFYVQYVHLL